MHLSTPTHRIPIPVDGMQMASCLQLPPRTQGVVLCTHGHQPGHLPQAAAVTRELHAQHLGTWLLDLLSLGESLDPQTRFDISLLTHRLLVATRWAMQHAPTQHLPLGYFCSQTSAAAALQAAAALPECIKAVASHDGRPDLAGPHDLARVQAPTLLLVDQDTQAQTANHAAYVRLQCDKSWSIVAASSGPLATPTAQQEVARLTAAWFRHHLHGL